jgi:3-methyladenine DNA glycosylase/8-oxoguanine DNA glycosylase
MTVTISVPPTFNFWRTVYSHGWCALPPFVVDKDNRTLSLIADVSGGGSGRPMITNVSQPRTGTLKVRFARAAPRSVEETNRSIAQVKAVLRLGEDFSGFYTIARRHRSFRWVAEVAAGRLLRAPTVFEDVAKMICTTNCSWALTETIVNNLCVKIGVRVSDSTFTFPEPAAIAECSEKFLRREIRAGYRSPYLLELGRRITRGELDIESWRQTTLPTEELYEEVCSVKGIGPYAAGNILKLLGRYDYLAIDSWCRKKFSEIHKNGRKINDSVIEKFYKPFGKWKGLFFWMDVTKQWYDHEFPF